MFLTILIIHFFSSFHSKSITLHFDQYSIERPYPDITLDNICHFNTYINTYLSYSLLTVPSCLSPQPVSNTSIHLCNNYEVTSYTSSLSLSDHIFNNYPLYLSNSKIDFGDQGLALGYHYNDRSYSLIHQMYDNNQIDHLSFSIEPRNKDGDIIFGSKNSNGYRYKGVLSVKENLPTWGFSLKGIKHKNVVKDFNIDCIIHSGEYDMFYSNEVLKYFKDELFSSLIRKGRCEYNEDEKVGDYIHCDRQVIEDKDIEF